jgi:type IV secretory pathway TraG/TraD family ATPase VirD4
MNKDKNSTSDQFFIFIISIVLAAIIINKYGPAFLLFLAKHRYWVAGIISSLVMATWVAVRQKLVAAWEAQEQKRILFKSQEPDSICVGRASSGQPVYVPISARRMHTQVVGTTNAGKTESVIIPWAVSDIRAGRGLILIDGKSDRALLDKLYAYCVQHRRAKDFRLLSLVNIGSSATLNPLIGGSPEEITERVFSSFTFEDEYYKNQQYEVLKHVLILLSCAKVTPTFQRLIQVISEPDLLLKLSKNVDDEYLRLWVARFIALAKDERERRSSGLVTQMGHFATGETSVLFNDDSPLIDVEQVMREGSDEDASSWQSYRQNDSAGHSKCRFNQALGPRKGIQIFLHIFGRFYRIPDTGVRKPVE